MSGPTVVAYRNLDQKPVLRRTDCCSALLQPTFRIHSMQIAQRSFNPSERANILREKAFLISHIPNSKICSTCQKTFTNLQKSSLTSSQTSPSFEDLTSPYGESR